MVNAAGSLSYGQCCVQDRALQVEVAGKRNSPAVEFEKKHSVK